MFLEVISPTKKIFENEVTAVQLPGTEGSFEILRNHAPLIATLGSGDIRIKVPGHKDTFLPITSGVVEVNHNRVIVLVSSKDI